MHIQTTNSSTPASALSRPAAPERASAPPAAPDQFQRGVTSEELRWIRQIHNQEMVIRASYALPWATAALASTSFYLATSSTLGAGLAAPIGLLIGAGIADALSGNAQARIEEAEAQLDAGSQKSAG